MDRTHIRVKALKDSKAQLVAERATNIKALLKQCEGTEFANVSVLSNHLSQMYLIEHSDVINPATLRRNKVYRPLLDNFLKGKKKILNDNALMQEQVLLSGLEIADLKRENRQLLERLAEAYSATKQLELKNLEMRSHGHNEAGANPDVESLLLALYKVVSQVEYFTLHKDKITNDAEFSEDQAIVLTKDECPPFFDWMQSQGKEAI
ncbi:hypothetical protein [Paraferrimonas haliotis]|uniref:Uncharacterized protein n=1 Tax=Paraferrimonas haliotis TaxID=2013866 RepID=A0AA37TYP5_9GAMM|nr:hypothetical protein [Paraferrimonas haliotis]GLS83741.1 hypothetical protein GCM10007894_17180 [Paraferrimonas haliotis]